MEQKYIHVTDGELVFDSATHDTLNERNIDEANIELAERAIGCRRDAEHYIDKDIKNAKIMAFFLIAVSGIIVVISTVWTIVLDWGFFMVIVLSGIALLFGLFALLYSIKKQKSNARIRDNGELYFAQTVKAPTPIFIAKQQCACVIDGKPRILTYRTNTATFLALQKKDYIIIAYDKATDKFLPIRLFEKVDIGILPKK